MTTSSLNIKQFTVWIVNVHVELFLSYCISYSSYSKEYLSFWQFWKIITVTWIFARYIGRVGERLLHVHISSIHIHCIIVIYWSNKYFFLLCVQQKIKNFGKKAKLIMFIKSIWAHGSVANHSMIKSNPSMSHHLRGIWLKKSLVQCIWML